MKAQKYILVFALGFAVTLSGCSLFKQSGESAEEQAPVADASTDAIPDADPESLPADTAAAAPEMQAAPEALAEPVADPVAEVAQPEPAAPPAETAAMSSGEVSDYSVKAGETLMTIAFENYGDLYKWKDIYEANKVAITDPNAIPAGTILKLEKAANDVVIERNGEKYMIKRGDTLGTISGEVYGTTAKWKKLWENNRQLIKNPNLIFAGFYLYYVPEAPELSPKPLANAGADAADQSRAPASVEPASMIPSQAGEPAQPAQ